MTRQPIGPDKPGPKQIAITVPPEIQGALGAVLQHLRKRINYLIRHNALSEQSPERTDDEDEAGASVSSPRAHSGSILSQAASPEQVGTTIGLSPGPAPSPASNQLQYEYFGPGVVPRNVVLELVKIPEPWPFPI